jgi:hypothetical protein
VRSDHDGSDPRGLARRDVLRLGALTGAALAIGPVALGDALAATEPPRVRALRTLGRTGLRIPDIGFGSSQLSGDESVVRHALARGITYFDTAESYEGGASEETLGRALRGRRDEVTIASKTSAGASDGREEMMRALDGSLRRLQTDHVDVYFNHAVNDVARLQNPEWPEFVTRAKAAGKIRFTGMSGHGGHLVPCLDHAIDHDLLDVVLVGYNFGQDPSFAQRFTAGLDFVAVQPDLPRVLAKARSRGVGVVAMKTLRGAKLNDMRPYETSGGTFAQAAFRWVLSGPHVDALVVSMTSAAQIDEYLGASGAAPPGRAQTELLERYERANAASQCRYGCDACASACPNGVAIPDALRARMYAEDYGAAGLAGETWRALGPRAAEACLSCAHEACAGACPYGVAIPGLTRRAARALGGA